jgi:hypothetical protein
MREVGDISLELISTGEILALCRGMSEANGKGNVQASPDSKLILVAL